MASYSGTIDLRVTGNALKEVDLITKRINDLRSLTKSLKPVPNLFDKRGSERITKEKEELRKLVEQYGKGTGSGNRFSNTIAGLNSQLSGFNRILSNVNIKSDEFVQSLTASEKISRRLSRAEAERLSVLNKINTASTVGRAGSVKEVLDLSKIIPKSVAGLEFYQQQLQDTLRTVNIGSSDYRELAAAIASVNQQLSVAQGSGRIQGPALPPGFNERGRIPSGGGGGRRGGRFQDIATGAGFPLLFGGGPIQALAGGLGGAAGGLGGSIAASALTAQVEAFAKEAAKVGQALNSTSGALELVREKSLFSSEEIKERALELEKQGRVEELAALLTGELTQLIGNEGVRSLQELGKTTNETTKLWNQLTTQLFALVSGPLNAFLKVVNQVLGAVAGAGSREAFFGDLGSQEGAARSRFKVLTGESLGTGRSGSEARAKAERAGQVFLSQEDALAQIRKEFKPVKPASIPVTKQDRRDFSVSGGDKAAREQEKARQRIDALRREREEIVAISTVKDKIALAEAANDSQLVIRLQGQQRLRQLETERLNDLAKAKTAEEAQAINQTAIVKALAAQLDTTRQLTENDRERQELFDTTIEGLEHQLKMTEATSQAERDRLKIAKEMKKLEDKGLKGDQLAQVGSIMEQLAVAQQPLNAFIRKATEDLNNLQQVAVDVSQGIGNAIGGSLVNGLQGLVTGATSVKQVFADMLKSVADVLAKTASQMIAQYIAIGIAKMFAGMGGGGEGNTRNFDLVGQYMAEGAYTPGGFEAFDQGGVVSKPTLGLVGEGGEPEYIIPESKMRESMSRYSRGSRGGGVIPSDGGSSASGDGGVAVAAPIDVRYTVERINSVDYVTADQFQSGMQSAAAQGAQRGEQNTLKRLQMSGSTRKRIGL